MINAESIQSFPCTELESRQAWLSAAEGLLAPLAELMKPGTAGLPLAGRASNHDPTADRLESFARPGLLAAHWLFARSPDQNPGLAQRLMEFFVTGLAAGTDPSSPQYWGPASNYHQHVVEMGSLVLALEIAGDSLWEPVPSREKGNILSWLASARGGALHRNNHLFFGVLVLSFLAKEGAARPGDAAAVNLGLDTLESMALGNGWFVDGMNESIDHYNAFTFHYYSLWWARLYGADQPERVKRWRDWTAEFLQDYAHFFAASGEPVPFGRSLTYRFAACAPFAPAALAEVSPLPPGLSRRISSRCLKFFLDRAPTQSQGALSIGWVDEFPPLAEAYSCAGSPYWAAKGFSPLLLPADHAFWTAESVPLPAERGEFARVIPSAGFVIRSRCGEVELFNTATAICGGNTAYGPYKWGKLCHRTGTGFEIAGEGLPTDAALCAESQDGTRYGRQWTQSVELTEHLAASRYSLGDKTTQFNVQVDSRIWWRGDWQLHLHHAYAHQPARLILGSQSLASRAPEDLSAAGTFPWMRAENRHHRVALQSLAGFTEMCARATSGSRRVHLLGPHSLCLELFSPEFTGERVVLALCYCGPAAHTEAPRAWTPQESSPGHLRLEHPQYPPWTLHHPSLPRL